MIKQIFWRGLVFLRLTLPLVTDQLIQHVSSIPLLIPTFVVDVEAIILTAAGDVVSVCGQANKVLLVNVT